MDLELDEELAHDCFALGKRLLAVHLQMNGGEISDLSYQCGKKSAYPSIDGFKFTIRSPYFFKVGETLLDKVLGNTQP